MGEDEYADSDRRCPYVGVPENVATENGAVILVGKFYESLDNGDWGIYECQVQRASGEIVHGLIESDGHDFACSTFELV